MVSPLLAFSFDLCDRLTRFLSAFKLHVKSLHFPFLSLLLHCTVGPNVFKFVTYVNVTYFTGFIAHLAYTAVEQAECYSVKI